MSLDDNDVLLLSTCANCGKGEEESTSLKTCGACMLVKYCNSECQKAHRPQHKKECRLRVAELHEEALFKQPPPQLEDCPICFLRMPSLATGWKYSTCCGKIICSGCVYVGALVGDDKLCPFCRTPAPFSDEENIKRVKKRVEVGDAGAFYNLGCDYAEGMYGMPQDLDKALELLYRAGELGHAASYCNIGYAYFNGEGVERDKQKAKHYWELAAMGGDVHARHNLGTVETCSGNMNKALKHYMIAVGSGYHDSLMNIKQLYSKGFATKDDYAKALKAYQAYLVEVKSDQRDEAAAYNEGNKYYK